MENKTYQTIFYELNDKVTDNDLKDIFLKMSDSGSVFFLCNDSYDSLNNLDKSSLDYTEQIINLGFSYINTIIIPKTINERDAIDNVKYLLWFTKGRDQIFFLKDEIREKHIWKDVEWGKRKKNYNPKGKDPGNVWLPTEDDGKGKIINHIILNDLEIIERCVVSTSKKNDSVFIYFHNKLPYSKILSDRKVTYELSIVPKISIKPNIKINPIISDKVNPIVVFDTAEKMSLVKDKSVDLMVTSPPYWDLKNYLKDGQIGQETYLQYLGRLKLVWEETFRVLNDRGSMWININTRTKNKKPILIPQDIINQSREIGFKLKKIIIWHKSSGIPTHKNNILDRFEYFLWFVKSNEFYFNSNYLSKVNDYQNKNLKGGTIWNINRKAGSVGKDYVHPAIYPIKLIERIIMLCSVEGQLVLDPFLGSGTSLIAAENMKRSFIGYEFNEDFESLIKHRLETSKIDKESVEFKNRKEISINTNFYRKP